MNGFNQPGYFRGYCPIGIPIGRKSTTSNKFQKKRGYMREERLVLSNPTHHSWRLALKTSRYVQICNGTLQA